MLSGIRSRRVAAAVMSALEWSPVVAITGPRTAGKTTLARQLASDLHGVLLDLDDPAVRALAHDDPTSFISDLPEPVVIDEFQRAPGVLAAIKAELNRDLRPARYLLTGSARPDAVPDLADYLTGRVALITLWPFAEAELVDLESPSIIDRLFGSGGEDVRAKATLTRADVVELVQRGGYPIAAGLPPQARDRWFSDLSQLVVERMSGDVQHIRNPASAAAMLRLVAARTAQISNAADIGRDAGLGRDQAGEYLRLLRMAYLTHELPAWSTNVSSRQIKRPKVHMVDSGLAAHLQGPRELSASDPVGASRFGALFETFVVGELLKQLGWSSTQADLYHFRSSGGAEVDVVVEASDGRIVGVEVKAGTRVRSGDSSGLRLLRDRLGARFVAGVVVTTGQFGQRIDDRVFAMPVEQLWSPA